MKKARHIFSLLLLLMASTTLWAQNASPWVEQNCSSLYPTASLAPWKNEGELRELAFNYLRAQLPDLQQPYTGLQLTESKESPFGRHLTYNQVYNSISIFGAEIKINIGKNGRVLSVFYKTVNTQDWPKDLSVTVKLAEDFKAVTGPCDNIEAKPVIYYTGQEYLPAYAVEYSNNDGSLHNIAVIGTDNKILYAREMARHYSNGDTTGRARVFYPDPLTSAKVPYGAPYIDADDSDIAELNAQRILVNIPVTYAEDTFRLKGPYATIVDISPPFTSNTFSLDGNFYFTRHQYGFEDANAYFHIHNFQKHVKTLGFPGLGNASISVDAHALSGVDNSEFDYPSGKPMLLFGQGGIDDAEDADVIVHEYNHYLTYDALGSSTTSGTERNAMEEGWCDYFACSYSRNISEYNWKKVYSWDGNETWSGRSCFTTKMYPQDLSSDRYKNAEIWSGTLMEIWEKIGRDSTDKLMLGSLYFMHSNISMMDAARIFVQLDSMMSGGQNDKYAIDPFVDHGLLPKSYKTAVHNAAAPLEYKLISSYFASHNLLYLEFDEPQTGTISLYDMQGRIILQENLHNDRKATLVTPPLPSGMYLLRVEANGKQKTEKLLR